MLYPCGHLRRRWAQAVLNMGATFVQNSPQQNTGMLRILVKKLCRDFVQTSDHNHCFNAMEIPEMSHRVAKDA